MFCFRYPVRLVWDGKFVAWLSFQNTFIGNKTGLYEKSIHVEISKRVTFTYILFDLTLMCNAVQELSELPLGVWAGTRICIVQRC
jgi:hypothetical protein